MASPPITASSSSSVVIRGPIDANVSHDLAIDHSPRESWSIAVTSLKHVYPRMAAAASAREAACTSRPITRASSPSTHTAPAGSAGQAISPPSPLMVRTTFGTSRGSVPAGTTGLSGSTNPPSTTQTRAGPMPVSTTGGPGLGGKASPLGVGGLLDVVEPGRVGPQQLVPDLRRRARQAGVDRLGDVAVQAGHVGEVGLEQQVVDRHLVQEVGGGDPLEPEGGVDLAAEQLRRQQPASLPVGLGRPEVAVVGHLEDEGFPPDPAHHRDEP